MSMYGPFVGLSAAKLTSTTGDQTLTVPAGYGSLVAYNGATGTVYLKWNAAASVPTGALAAGLTAVPPGSVISTSCPIDGGALHYIADTTGGELMINLGEGF